MKVRPGKSEVHVSSGNVFADLGGPQPNQELVKADLVRTICSIVSGKGFRQVDAAARLGISQPKVSLLMRGRTDGFSTGHLMRLLNRLGQSINIVVTPSRSGAIARTRVKFAGAAMLAQGTGVYRAAPSRGAVPALSKVVRTRAAKEK
jgi:predicted XRE-type DNA-binding protein